MRDGLSHAAVHGLLLTVILHQAEGARHIERDIALPPGCFDLRCQPGQSEPLIDVPAGHTETMGNLVGGFAFSYQRCERIDFVDRVHFVAMDVLHEGDFPPLFQCHNVARHEEVPGDDLVARKLLERSESPPSCIDLERAFGGRDDAEVLEQTARRDRRRQGVNVRLAVFPANVPWRSNKLAEGDQLN